MENTEPVTKPAMLSGDTDDNSGNTRGYSTTSVDKTGRSLADVRARESIKLDPILSTIESCDSNEVSHPRQTTSNMVSPYDKFPTPTQRGFKNDTFEEIKTPDFKNIRKEYNEAVEAIDSASRIELSEEQSASKKEKKPDEPIDLYEDRYRTQGIATDSEPRREVAMLRDLINKQYQKLDDETTKLHRTIDVLQAQKVELLNNNWKLEAQLTEKIEECHRLQAEVSQARDNLTTLQSEREKVLESIGKNADEEGDVLVRETHLKEEIHKLSSAMQRGEKLENLKLELIEAECLNETLKQQMKVKEDKFALLESQYARQTKERDDLEHKRTTLEMTVDDLLKEVQQFKSEAVLIAELKEENYALRERQEALIFEERRGRVSVGTVEKVVEGLDKDVLKESSRFDLVHTNNKSLHKKISNLTNENHDLKKRINQISTREHRSFYDVNAQTSEDDEATEVEVALKGSNAEVIELQQNIRNLREKAANMEEHNKSLLKEIESLNPYQEEHTPVNESVFLGDVANLEQEKNELLRKLSGSKKKLAEYIALNECLEDTLSKSEQVRVAESKRLSDEIAFLTGIRKKYEIGYNKLKMNEDQAKQEIQIHKEEIEEMKLLLRLERNNAEEKVLERDNAKVSMDNVNKQLQEIRSHNESLKSEVSHLNVRLSKNKDENDNMKSIMEKAKTLEVTHRTALEKLQSETESLSQQRQEVEKLNMELKKEIDKVSGASVKLTSDNNVLSNDITKKTYEIQSLTTHLDAATSKVTELEHTVAARYQELCTVRNDYNQTELQKNTSEKELKILKDELKGMRIRNDELKGSMIKDANKLLQLREKTKDMDEMKEKYEKLLKDHERMCSEKLVVQQRLDAVTYQFKSQCIELALSADDGGAKEGLKGLIQSMKWNHPHA